MLETKKVTAGSNDYVVTEMKMGDMLPILPRLSGDPETAQNAQVDMLKLCILVDGKQIGDGVLELSVKSYLILIVEVMAINGMQLPEDAGAEGKDSTHTK